MDNNKKRKDIIKNIAIVFLAIMLVLTYFSNTIMNISLPEVAAEYVTSGAITNKVRGTGTVESADPYIVGFTGKGTRVIKEVNVRVGDEVKKGDVLYTFEEGITDATDSEGENALTEAENAVKAAKKEYENKIIELGYSEEETEAITAEDASENTAYKTTAAKLSAAVKAAQEKVDSLTEKYEELDRLVDIWGDDYGHGIQEKIDLIKLRDDSAEAKEYWPDVIEENENAYNKYVEAKDAYDKAEEAYNKAKEKYEKDPSAENKKAKNEAKTKYKEEKEKFEDASAKYGAGYTTYVNGKTALAEAKANYEYATKTLEKKKKDYEEERVIVEDSKKEAEKKLEAATKAFTEYKEGYEGDSDIASLYKAYQTAIKNYETIKKEYENVTVTSPVTGTVLKMNYTAGMKISASTVEAEDGIASVQLAGKGFTLSFSIPNEKVKFISVGDIGEVSRHGDDVTAKIATIRPDKDNPTSNKVVTFDITGDVSNGQSLTISVGERTANYDVVVPNSAVREDNGGKFIYIIESKSTPLGNRYIAKRVDVTILAEDDTTSAVSGAIDSYVYVITKSSKPIEDGQQVRFKD